MRAWGFSTPLSRLIIRTQCLSPKLHGRASDSAVGGDQALGNTQDPNYELGRWFREDLNSDLQHPHQKLGVATQTPVTPLWWRLETGLAEARWSDGLSETMRVSRNKADSGRAGPLTPSSTHVQA